MEKEGSLTRASCVGICEGCLCLIADTGHGGHRRRCPQCGEMVCMTPADDLVSGFQDVADAVDQILPESIFHNRSLCPWPVLYQGQWHVDVRCPPGSEYGDIARKYFPLPYKRSIDQFMDNAIPKEAVMGDWLEESVVIAPEEITGKKLFRFIRNLNTWRQNWTAKGEFDWQETLASWVSKLSKIETEQLIKRLDREQRIKSQAHNNTARLWLRQTLKAHRNASTWSQPHI